MNGELPSDLVASRLAVRFYENGRPFLGSLMRSASVPIGPEVAAVCAALWSRTDPRGAAERLASWPGVPGEPVRGFVVKRLLDAGLLVPRSLDEEVAWLERQDRELEPVPRIDQVELTNACPFTCGFCPRGRGAMSRPVGHMDLGLLAQIVEQVKGLPARKPFGLHHFGDPLLHPDPAGAVRVVRAAGLEPELSLNPVLLKEATAEALLDAGVGVLIVSMDGLDTATLQAMRGKPAGRFEEAERNVEKLIELASKMERPPTIMVSMVATTLNRHQWGELFERYRRPDLPFLTPVVRLLEDFGEPGIAPLAVRRLRQVCACPWKSVSVLWDGTVVPCCHDHDGRAPLGDLRRQSLAEIWRGAAVSRLRERIREHRCAEGEPCSRCRWRPDLYLAEDEVADMDAWTPALWPDGPFPPR